MIHFGIDYGSKLAGTTAICYEEENFLHVVQSEKKKSADDFVEKWILEKQPEKVFIDAPLSLPASYFGKGDDYFYRKCDKAVQGMSPMFLGGLTARALQLRSKLESSKRTFYEIYPAHLLRILFPTQSFKKGNSGLQDIWELLKPQIPVSVNSIPENRHQLDAFLAWYSGWRYLKGKAIFFGIEEEGLIWV